MEFISQNKILSSKSEARRAIANKGLKINDKVVLDDSRILSEKDFKEKTLKISFGKKKHYIVKII